MVVLAWVHVDLLVGIPVAWLVVWVHVDLLVGMQVAWLVAWLGVEHSMVCMAVAACTGVYNLGLLLASVWVV